MQAYQKLFFSDHDHSFRINYTFGMVLIQIITVIAMCINNNIFSEYNTLKEYDGSDSIFLKDDMKNDH